MNPNRTVSADDRSSREHWLSRNLLIVLFGLFTTSALLAGLILLVYWVHFRGPISASHGVWGEFGEFVGGTLGSLFAFLSFLALLLTITIQNRELAISSRELRNSAKALEEQGGSLRLQNFERTFFALLGLYTDSVTAIDLRASEGNLTALGRDCFRIFHAKRLRAHYNAVSAEKSYVDARDLIEKAYDRFFKEEQHEIGHCFRTLYRVLKYVDERGFAEQRQYAGILRAQLSSFELALLFYNGLHPIGGKLKPLLEKYAMFENAQLELLFDPGTHASLYLAIAYGDREVGKHLA